LTAPNAITAWNTKSGQPEKVENNDGHAHGSRNDPIDGMGQSAPNRQILSVIHVERRQHQNVGSAHCGEVPARAPRANIEATKDGRRK
jgi:hypothetical protein